MQHRHLEKSDYSLAALDDIISNGKWADWIELQKEVVRTPALRAKIKQICEAYISDPYAQRYHFWMNNAK